METQAFCKECGDLLYHKEDTNDDILYLQCYNCDHFEVSQSYIVQNIDYKSKYEHSISQDIAKELTNDPTLPITTLLECPQCKTKKAVYFESKGEEAKLSITYICCFCYRIFGI